MSALQVNPFEYFTDTNGDPLDAGFIYVGVANLDPETNPISVYYDAALTLPVAQPIRTTNGYVLNAGTPVSLYVNATDYSVRARNKNLVQIYYYPSFLGVSAVGQLVGQAGASLVGFINEGAGAVPRTVQNKLYETKSVFDYMTAAERTDALSATPTLDLAVSIQKAIDAVGAYGTLIFPKTTANVYLTSVPLKFYNGQTWIGSGGTDLNGTPTIIRLTAAGSCVALSSSQLLAITTGARFQGIWFDGQSFSDSALNLTNCSYTKIDQCGGRANKAGAAVFLFDSVVSYQCYFNQLNQCRGIATGANSVGVRFTRGANANQVYGGKFGSGVRGMEFLSLSTGNLVMGTDFEQNTDCDVYVDAPDNIFMGAHMEGAPIGFNITANGNNTGRVGCTYATATTVNVQDVSKTGAVVDTRHETSGTSGDLRFGAAKFLSTFFSSSTNLLYDPDLNSGTADATISYFRNTTTTGVRSVTFYKGDGTASVAHALNTSTGQVTHGDLVQFDAIGGIARRIIRRSGIPATGTYVAGDVSFNTSYSTNNPVQTYVCITGGTSGTWQALSWVVLKNTTGQRPNALGTAGQGVQYLDTTLAAAGKPIWWAGTQWVDATGAVV